MAEYRLEDLARESGVSTRNIRAYRERGLLHPPRRAGRTVLYDEVHLERLTMISELLGRGFTFTHIADFLARMDEGRDVADILGLRPASHDGPAAVRLPGLDPAGAAARRLVELGVAEVADGSVMLTDAGVADAVAAAPDRELYVDAVVRILDTATPAIDELARRVVESLENHLASQTDSTDLPALSTALRTYRDAAVRLTALRLDSALRVSDREDADAT